MSEGPEIDNSVPFGGPSDYAECRRIHRKFGTTYYFASRRFPAQTRKRVDALYGFVRVPDEWVDNSAARTVEETARLLESYREEFLNGLQGVRPVQPVLRTFCDLVREVQMPIEEPLLFLGAMESDLSVNRYSTYDELRTYMRGSAAAVGVMMCYVLNAPRSEEILEAAKALGEAMQLTNFLRDVGEDAARNRVYLPQEELDEFGVSCEDIFEARLTPGFKNLMKYQIRKARTLYAIADQGIQKLPESAKPSVYIARVLYSRILDRIESRDFDVFSARARTSKLEKLLVAGRVLVRGVPISDALPQNWEHGTGRNC